MKISIIIILFFGLFSCVTPDENAQNLKKVAREVNDRKLKRVTEKDLQKWIIIKGSSLVPILQKNLIKAYRKEAIENIHDFYKIKKIPTLDSLAEAYQIKIQKIPFENPENITLNILQRNQLKWYASEENDQKSVLKIDYPEYFYFAPIVLENKTVGMWSIHFSRQQAIRFYDFKELIN
jgi:hypothetical protein